MKEIAKLLNNNDSKEKSLLNKKCNIKLDESENIVNDVVKANENFYTDNYDSWWDEINNEPQTLKEVLQMLSFDTVKTMMILIGLVQKVSPGSFIKSGAEYLCYEELVNAYSDIKVQDNEISEKKFIDKVDFILNKYCNVQGANYIFEIANRLRNGYSLTVIKQIFEWMTAMENSFYNWMVE